MALAIIVSGVLMVVMAAHVARFLEGSRMYEVLGLFVLLLVGIMLMSEGGHLAHLAFFGYEIGPMSKATFYFVLVTVVLVDVVQGRYQRKIMAEAAVKSTSRPAATQWSLHPYVVIPYVTSQPNQFLVAVVTKTNVLGEGRRWLM